MRKGKFENRPQLLQLSESDSELWLKKREWLWSWQMFCEKTEGYPWPRLLNVMNRIQRKLFFMRANF